jgi:hypothetical protein
MISSGHGMSYYVSAVTGYLQSHTGASTSRAPPQVHVHEPIRCDRCTDTFSTKQEYTAHRSYMKDGPCADHNHKTPPKSCVGYRDPDMPQLSARAAPTYSNEPEETTELSDSPPTDLSDSELWCSQCKNRFHSHARMNIHYMWCATKHGSSALPAVVKATEASHTTRRKKPRAKKTKAQAPAPQFAAPVASPTQAPMSSPAPSFTASATHAFTCDFAGCQKSFRSEGGLKVHKGDIHGIGKPKIDLMGGESWMLNQRAREQARAEGRLQPPSGPSRGRGGSHTARTPPPMMSRAQHHPPPQPIPAFGTLPRASVPTQHSSRHIPVQHAPARTPVPLPASRDMGGPFEMEQAKYIQGKILALLIQSDILIHHDGKITVCGILWTRIGVEKQREVVGLFDKMCHLPPRVQGEYLPPPKTFLDDYNLQYPASDFQSSPPRDRAKPGLGVVALACSKVILANGLEEVVKISAVDVVTCRILMNYLVCGDPSVRVKDWRSNETGLFSWDDMEHARKQKYRVFKGWAAARSALWKYVDKETIILGNNLRSDLDALRMVHGRAVDIAKVAEKAAKGSLSKAQLGLDSMCRDFPAITLKSDPEYGRDVLMNAFAIREMGLWLIKNEEAFEKKIRQKSVDLQKVVKNAA